MATWVVIVILAAYASLLAELTIFRVPSVASSLAIWSPQRALVAMYSARYRRFFALARSRKLLLFVVPLLVVYAVYLYPLLVIAVGPDLLRDYLFTPTPTVDVGATALILSGRLIAITAALTIRQHNDQTGKSFYLHTSGVFRLSRNPGLVGMYLFMAGIWLTMPSATMLAGIFVYVAYMHFKVLMEEDFLENKFGAPYMTYQAKTARYIP
jgi:protein-S-isoprenylcysteine O-methyltransferase Ste14